MSNKLTQYTLSEVQKMLRSKEVSSVELTKAYQENIANEESEIGAYITLTPEIALESAKKVDAKIANGEEIAPLAGIPCAIKDNMSTRGVKTTCASKMLENFIPPYDAFVCEKLKNQDIAMLGKANMDEFAMGSSTENSYFHPTKNPRNLEYVPGGSSGGSAAAVAGDEAVFALGSDTGGSIRQPASFCGVVGMKPTYGTVSRNGLVAFASSLDQIGPLTKTVEDNAIVLSNIVGHDCKDSTSINMQYGDFTSGMKDGVKGMKIALPKEYIGEGISDEVKESILASAKIYEKMGAEISEVSIKSLGLALPAYYVISSAEASSNLARFDGVRYGHRTSEFEDVLDLYKRSRSEGFGAEVKRRIMLGSFALSSGYYDAYYKKALQVRTLIMNDFAKVFEDYSFILSPVAPTPAYKLGAKTSNPLEMYLGDICSVPINIAGLPSLAMPCGESSEGLPIGMQLIGKAFSEPTLYRAGYAFEREFGCYHQAKTTGGAK
ncbi:MAG: Asp-tRNA(Asn)/Glu-tRNA(Gln) amidotransferase subunit GatA [Bacillota bacterium]